MRYRGLVAVLFAFPLSMPLASSARQGPRVFDGYISDSQCAMNVHSVSRSHREMLKSGKFGKTAADCVWICVKEGGGRFVLQSDRSIYKLDDQNIDRELAAQRVHITGTLDERTNTIHVLKIEPVEKHVKYRVK